ncbi:LysR substrate-binding domain-containing protein [Polaromonas sp.]|uniref:LysR substrate-binding domain-containing protein n=1 Tax=Polaromonas sp. TaxID=1869339 RepID=UPI00182C255E|nr:LysR substrate-binding domain-containing protein [Polaromonas sp.]NML87140.1 LysR family transcriptional regulator [Polaromonas sp.]
MSTPISAPSEMAFFSLLARCGSFSVAARELDVSTPAVSKRLAQMEARLGVQLLNRTTRRVGLTSEGETYLAHARRILADIDDMEQLVSNAVATPKGLLRVNATLGFGRSHIAPLISGFAKLHPQVEVRLQLSVDPPPLSEDAFDVCVRFGEPPDARVLARKLAPNRRLLCAAPSYLPKHGTPRVPNDLGRHDCIGIRQGDEAYGTWRLSLGKRTEGVKVRGKLSTNDGEIAVNWALAGHGIVLRAEWDIARYLRSGRLKQVLENYRTPSADIHAVYPQRHQVSARVRAFVDYLAAHFEKTSIRAAGLVADW